MTKHTPGPWHAWGNRLVRAAHPGRPDCSVNIAEGCIPYRPGLKEEDSDAEQCRNLLLIAAAPELFEALLRMRDEVREFLPNACGEALTQAEAAIRKARGDTP